MTQLKLDDEFSRFTRWFDSQSEEMQGAIRQYTLTGSTKVGDSQANDIARRVLRFLNHKVARNFPPTSKNIGMIVNLLKKDGATEQDMRAVIIRQSRKWKNTDQETYLRPATLFNRTKYAQYVGEVGR